MIGEAGLGKSRLIEELRTDFSANGEPGIDWPKIDWIEAGGISYDTSHPYGLFVRLLRRSFSIEEHDPPDQVREKVGLALATQSLEERGRLTNAVELLLAPGASDAGTAMDGETVKRQVFEAILSVWRGVSSPTVMVSEDIHWADPASVELLIHLFQLADQVPILFPVRLQARA